MTASSFAARAEEGKTVAASSFPTRQGEAMQNHPPPQGSSALGRRRTEDGEITSR